MANLFDYLTWRGDIPFKIDPFNEVDNLILAWLTYVHFDEVMPRGVINEPITIYEAGVRYFQKKKLEDRLVGFSLTKSSAILLQQLMECPRFENIKISNFVNEISEKKQSQFSAMVFELDRRTIYVGYRGTDDTIIGWKEDFNMCFMPYVPSQKEAVAYLEQISKIRREKMILGGHSKGGNLAVYAAMNAQKLNKSRIIQIYNNDGPGFEKETMASESYLKILPKIRTFLPESSVVGMLFEHGEKAEIVKSSQKGLLQHDASSWEVRKNRFVYLESVSDASKIIDDSIKSWIASLDEEQRRMFVESIFTMLDAVGVKTTGELYNVGLKGISSAFKSFTGMDAEMKQRLLEITKVLFGIMSQNVKANLNISKSEK